MGYGTLTAPFTLQEALNAPHIGATGKADIIELATGTYSGNFTASLVGRSVYLIVRPAAGAQVTISGALNTTGCQYVEFQDIEFVYPWAGDRASYTKDNAPGRMHIIGSNLKFINCHIHDITQISCFTNAINIEFYGCIVGNNGIYGADGNLVHNLYTQNTTGSTKKFTNCIFTDGISQFTIHGYGESGNLINFELVDCIVSGTILLFGGASNLVNLTMDNNVLNILTRLGYEDDLAINSSVVRGNFWCAGKILELYNHASLTLTGNTFAHKRPFTLLPLSGQDVDAYTINNNHYTNTDNDLRFVRWQDGVENQYTSLVAWQAATPHDDNSDQQSTSAAWDRVVVKTNSYDTSRAHVGVVNAALANTAVVDLTDVTGLEAGQDVLVHNAYDYDNDIQVLTLDANKQITINMQAANRTIAAPVEGTAPTSPYPGFGIFVVRAA